MSKLETNTIDTVSGTSTLQVGSTNTSTITLGVSGDTINVPSGVTINNNGTQTGFGGVNTPAFHATASGSQVIATNTATKLEYGSEVFDVGSCYDTSNYRFLPTTAGKYYFKATARSTSTTDFSQMWMQIYKNGSVVSRTIVPHDDYSSVSGSIIIAMNGSSDYLEAFFSHTLGSNLTLENQTYSCYSEGFKIIE